jgi:hypothetical protein
MKMIRLLFPARATELLLAWLAVSVSAVFASDVKTYVVEKGVQYFQTGVGTPTPDANNGAGFEADVKSPGTNLVTDVQIQLPNARSTSLPQDGSNEFKLKEKYNKQSSLDANFPNGAYTLTINSVHDGAKTLGLTLIADLYPSLAPRISNFPATQLIDAGAYFQFTWDAFAEGGINDFVQLHIQDAQGNKVWETPDLDETGALDGRATSVLLPALALQPGQTYNVNLDFARASQRDLSSYPGALGAALYFKRTKFTIQTAAAISQADVKLYTLSKSRRYEQTGDGAPILQPVKTFDIDAAVDAASPGSVTSASLLLPDGAPEALKLQSDGKTLNWGADALTQDGLDAAYPDGAFTFQVAAAAGTKTLVLNLTGDAYPNPPQLLNLAGVVDPNRDWLVSWQPFNGGTENDFTQLHIEDGQGNKVFETPDFGKSGALNGTALQATVPGNTLAAGATYTARVVFQKNLALDTTQYPGALGVAGYATRTTFLFSASAGVPTPPRLGALPFLNSGEFSLLLEASPGSVVQIERSSDLRQWTSFSVLTLPASGQATLTNALAGPSTVSFYRAVLTP